MQAIVYIVQTLITLYQAVLLLRLLMQLTRADFRNPLGRAVVQLTDPVILPLRRLLPPMGKIDSASVAAILIVSAVKIAVIQLLWGFGLPSVVVMVHGVALDLLRVTLNTYLFSMILNGLLSFVAQGNQSPAQSLLASICNPILNPVRRVIPPIAGLDLSPLWVCIAIQAVLIGIGQL
jgi:YggT family protein